jgi:hypothetical protein
MIRLLAELREYEADVDQRVADDVLDWFDRRNDTKLIREKMKNHFAVEVKKASITDSDETSTGDSYETYERGMTAAAIDAGLYEVANSGVGPKIAQARATLFTAPSQHWSWSADGVDEIIEEHRQAGQFGIEASNADYIACACESGVLHISWHNGHLQYQAIAPHTVHVRFPDRIEEESEQRAPVYWDLEDAAFVVLETGSVNLDGQTYQTFRAYYGESDAYPKGRCVDYTSTHWADVPPLGDPRVTAEYMDGDEPANPLTLYVQQSGENRPEYPIAVLRGGITRTKRELFPFTSSLYETSVEIELAWSRILKDGLDAMHGRFFVKSPAGMPLPKPSADWIALQNGQDVELLSTSSGEALTAADMLRQLITVTSSGYDVPDYQVIAVPAGQEPSGIALAIKTQPLIEHRDRRVKINSSQVARIFDIERGLINIHGEREIGEDVEQTWDPGAPVLAADRQAKFELIQAQLDKGFISYLEAVRQWHNLPSIEAAREHVETMLEHDADVPRPAVARTGALPGLGAGRVPPPPTRR